MKNKNNDVNEKDPLTNFVYSYFIYLKKKINFFPQVYLNKNNKNKKYKSNFININLIKKEHLISQILISDNGSKNIKLDIREYNTFFKEKLDLYYKMVVYSNSICSLRSGASSQLRSLYHKWNTPFWFLEYNQLNKAVLIPPMCRGPVGDGANLVATLDIKNI